MTRPAAPAPRPLALTVSLLMTIVASIEWLFVLFVGWLFLTALNASLSTDNLTESVMLNFFGRMEVALREGAIIPLALFPLLAISFAVAIAHRAEYLRVLYSILGLVTVGWVAWYFSSWTILVPVAAHIGLALVLVWSSSVTDWYRSGGSHG